MDPALLADLLRVPGYTPHVHKQMMLQALNNEVPKYHDHISSPGLSVFPKPACWNIYSVCQIQTLMMGKL